MVSLVLLVSPVPKVAPPLVLSLVLECLAILSRPVLLDLLVYLRVLWWVVPDLGIAPVLEKSFVEDPGGPQVL